MISLFVLGFSSIVAGALIEQRDPVPAGYVAPPYYPSTSSKSLPSTESPVELHNTNKSQAPHGGWTSDWSESYQKASMLVSNMTLAEKTNITAGTGLLASTRCEYYIDLLLTS
jgi:beta-glucosidase